MNKMNDINKKNKLKNGWEKQVSKIINSTPKNEIINTTTYIYGKCISFFWSNMSSNSIIEWSLGEKIFHPNLFSIAVGNQTTLKKNKAIYGWIF